MGNLLTTARGCPICCKINMEFHGWNQVLKNSSLIRMGNHLTTTRGFPFGYKINLELPNGYQVISCTKGSPSSLKEERKSPIGC
jgi:hypothetical protein